MHAVNMINVCKIPDRDISQIEIFQCGDSPCDQTEVPREKVTRVSFMCVIFVIRNVFLFFRFFHSFILLFLCVLFLLLWFHIHQIDVIFSRPFSLSYSRFLRFTWMEYAFDICENWQYNKKKVNKKNLKWMKFKNKTKK